MEAKLLHNVNTNSLPKSILKEFQKIYLEFRNGANGASYIIEAFDKLSELQIKKRLFENENNEDERQILTNEKYLEFINEYHRGFIDGYNSVYGFLKDMPFEDKDNKIKINRIFDNINGKFDTLKCPYLIEFENGKFLLIKLHLYEYGFEVGTYIKSWDLVLNNTNLFEEIFNQATMENKKKHLPIENSVSWQGTELEFSELVKALIESKKLSPELSQKEIFKRMGVCFNIESFNENDKIKDIRKRTNTPTPFLNILQTSLDNWIKRKD
jgi:hypothetical protein